MSKQLAASGAKHFADHLISEIRDVGHPLCVGLDPHLDLIPSLFTQGSMHPSDELTAQAIESFLSAVLERIAGRVAIVKPQIAFFEQLGWRGLRVLSRLCARAQADGLTVLLDAKRGDIGSTAKAYAKAYLTADATMPVNALTLNPYLGLDSLAEFAAVAAGAGKGLFVLVKTSNPGSGDLQDQQVQAQPLYIQVARGLVAMHGAMKGPVTGWSSLGVVCGATWPHQAALVREALPHALFLVPGYGAQGGSAADALAGFVPGPYGLEGGIVNTSRGVVFAANSAAASSTAAWEQAIDNALESSIDELGNAVHV